MPPVDIYTTAFCPYCAWAKELLTRKGVPYKEIASAGLDIIERRFSGDNAAPIRVSMDLQLRL